MTSAIDTVQTRDLTEAARCEVCGWPLAVSFDLGCVAGSCSYRPTEGSDEARRIDTRRAALDAHPLVKDGAAPRVPCPECGRQLHARVAEKQGESFRPGPDLRCVECKTVFRDPTLSVTKPDASVTEASGDSAGAVAFDPTTPLLGTAIIDRFGWDGADENRRFTATLHFPEGPPANLTFATVWDRCRVTIAENASDLPATPSADGPTEEQIILGESRIIYTRAINEIVKRADKTLHEAEEMTTGAIHEMVVSVHTDLHEIVEQLVDNEIAFQRRRTEAAPDVAANGSFHTTIGSLSEGTPS